MKALTQKPLCEDGTQRQKNAVRLTQPQINASYNKHMGGVNLLNCFLSDYKPRFRSRRWYCLFANFFNMSVVAAWQ